MRLSLSTTVPAFILAIGLGAVAVGAVVVSWRLPTEILEGAREDTTLLASMQSAEIAYHLRHTDPRDAHRIMDRLNADRQMVNALLVDDRGRIVLASRNALLDKDIEDTRYAGLSEAIREAREDSTHQTLVRRSDDSVFSLFPVSLGSNDAAGMGRPGVYVLHRNVSAVLSDRLGAAREILAWLAAIVALMSLALWGFLRAMMLKRVNRLIRSLDHVGEPGFSPPGGESGIGELSRIEQALRAASDGIVETRGQNERLRQLYQTLSEANQSIIRLPDRQQVFERLCGVIVQYGGFPLAWIGEPGPDGRVKYVASSGATDYLEHLNLAVAADSNHLVAQAFRTGEPRIVNDIDAPDSGLAQPDLARQYGFGAIAIFPLRCNGEVVALLTVYAREAGSFDDTEAGLLNELAGDVSFALDNYWRSEALQQSESRHRELFLSNPHPMWIYDLETLRFLEVNDTAVKHYGYTRDEFMAMTIADIRPPEDVEALKENIAAVTAGVDDAGVWRHVRKDGTVVDVEITSHTLSWKDRPAEVVLAHDVTERLHQEHELRIAAAAFEVQEGVVVADSNNVIERVNHAFTRITGYDADEVIGKTPRILQSGRHDRQFYEEMWREIRDRGLWEGEVWNRRKNGEIYPEWLSISVVKDRDGRVTHYVGSFLDITEDKEAEKKIHHLAFYDPLTDLANRRLLIDRLGRALAVSSRNDTFGAVLMLDFDHFKILNDTRGHAAGDALLVEAARRLKRGVRETDSVARMGGDEFIVVLEGLDPEEDTASGEAVRRAHQLQSSLSKPYDLAEVTDYRIGVCVGITLFKGREEEVDDLLRQADVALYEAKSEGRNALRFFNPERQKAIEVRASLEEDMRRALQNDEFRLHYQPQIDRDGRITGAEALLRWMPPGRDPVSPAEFIPVAEESGQILAISDWVLNTALTQLKTWQEQASTRHLSLSVNISAKHFHQPDFVDALRRHLDRTGADPSGLFLELTENVGLEPINRIIRQFNDLKQLDIRFSIDDFGTGYSSLSYIQRLPVDQIKIDRMFIDGLPDNDNGVAVVRAILAMSHAFGLNVIAEGVETEAQRAFLQKEGCDAYQGFLFGRPVPAPEFEALLTS